MTRDQARAIIGNSDRYTVGMARALCMLPWLNTTEDWTRVNALARLGYHAPRKLLARYPERKVSW